MLANAAEVLRQFRQIRALVIGDLMLDGYFLGRSSRLCQEAPVPIVDITQRQFFAGGAANCALNLAALGASTTVLGALGEDCEGQTLHRLLESEGVRSPNLNVRPGRSTLMKTRVLSDDHLVVRYDQGSSHSLDRESEDQICDFLACEYRRAELIVISDYGYGVLTERVIEQLGELQRRYRKTLVIDSKQLGKYRDLRPTLCKPNYQEAAAQLGWKQGETTSTASGDRVEFAQEHAADLLSLSGAEVVALTLDQEGSLVFHGDDEPYRTFATPAPAKRTSGAGDTYLSAFGLALAAGAPVASAAEIAAAAAGVVVEKTETATCSVASLESRLTGEPSHRSDLDALTMALEDYRKQGRRIVFTNGCFDILHRGHIAYLEQARRMGDVLIVGVNTDESIRRLKGPTRPINALIDRVRVLSALSSVSHVISFDDDTPHRLIEAIRPNVFVKGGDYTRGTLPEAELVERLGGVVKILSFVADRSTSRIISKICNVYGGGSESENVRSTEPEPHPRSGRRTGDTVGVT